ncbi:hypothetical protein FCM35_KLT11741 [Carex littledalei]|uniref:Uncharacterized protein n=1 Tax=Carex littledalei TaxID=544730 RepID=A0A833QRS4_9POAL|nr:hypothetical protein FCM35_KLT11741 [Carex littledalei]
MAILTSSEQRSDICSGKSIHGGALKETGSQVWWDRFSEPRHIWDTTNLPLIAEWSQSQSWRLQVSICLVVKSVISSSVLLYGTGVNAARIFLMLTLCKGNKKKTAMQYEQLTDTDYSSGGGSDSESEYKKVVNLA